MDIGQRTVTNGVATLTLARGKVNAIDPELVQALDRRLGEVESDDGIRAVVLTGLKACTRLRVFGPRPATRVQNLFRYIRLDRYLVVRIYSLWQIYAERQGAPARRRP